jgi:hypothetical protein
MVLFIPTPKATFHAILRQGARATVKCEAVLKKVDDIKGISKLN